MQCCWDEVAISKHLRRHPKFKLNIGSDGKIYSQKTGKPRALWKTRLGYLQLAVAGTSYLAHRLVADVWVPNLESKPFINHKNGIKDDNRADNLEWCTQKENIIHARDVLGIKYSASGFQNPNSKFLLSHQIILRNLCERGFSLAECSKIMGFCEPTIQRHYREITRT